MKKVLIYYGYLILKDMDVMIKKKDMVVFIMHRLNGMN